MAYEMTYCCSQKVLSDVAGRKDSLAMSALYCSYMSGLKFFTG